VDRHEEGTSMIYRRRDTVTTICSGFRKNSTQETVRPAD
jgi:hypothetical protein